MFYFHAARVLAILALIIGLSSAIVGFLTASNPTGGSGDVLRRYWPGETTGGMIDKGILLVVAAVVLGSLGEIGFAVRRLLAQHRE